MKYCEQIIANPFMKEWIEAAQAEPDDIEELEVEY
jgi:glutathione S-transferase